MKIKKLTYLILALSCISFKTDDSLKNVLRGIQGTYNGKSVSMDYIITYLTQENTKEVFDVGKTQYTPNSYYNIQGLEGIFMDKDYTIEINEQEKYLIVSKSGKQIFSNQNLPIDSMVNVLANEYKSNFKIEGDYYTFSADLYTYNLKYFISKQYHLKKVVYDFKNEADYKQMIVDYSNIKTDITPDYNTYKKIISINGNKLQGVGKYKEFKIIDNRML